MKKIIESISTKFICGLIGISVLTYIFSADANKWMKVIPNFKNETLKWVTTLLEDIKLIQDNSIVSKEFVHYTSIILIVASSAVLVMKLRYYLKEKKVKEMNKCIAICHSTVRKTQFNLGKTTKRINLEVNELDLLDDMENINNNYEDIKYVINKQDSFIEDFKRSMENINTYGYMGISHTPLILRAGHQIGDGSKFMLFHKKRSNEFYEVLNESEVYPLIKVDKKDTNKNSKELIVGIATTFEIKYDELKVLNPDDKNLILFKTENLGPDIIESRIQLCKYIDFIIKEVRDVVKEKDIKQIHMVISSSVSLTFALGQTISANHDPDIVIYHYEMKDSRKYTWGIKLFEKQKDCLVINNDRSLA